MKVKRFFSTSMQAVLKQVREDLGPDAVILSNTRVDDGIEVVAALDYEEEMLEQAFEPGQESPKEKAPKKSYKDVAREGFGEPLEGAQRSVGRKENTAVEQGIMERGKPSPSHLARMHAERHIKLQKEMERAKRRIEEVKTQRRAEESSPVEPINELDGSIRGEAHPNQASSPNDKPKGSSSPSWSELSDMKSEIMELKNLIRESQTAQPLKPFTKPALSLLQEQVEKTLVTLGLAQHLREKLVQQIANEADFGAAWQTIRQQLVATMNPGSGEIIDQGGVIALVGPTGSGKTMTIGKMAARYVMKYGADSIALVTTDRYRIAAHEQLKVFGRILNVPVYVVDDQNPLDQVLDALSQKKLVLVDTAGLLHTDSCWSEQLQELKMSRHQIQPYLTVSAVGQYQVMCANYHYYKIAGLAGVVVTKIDEAVSLGEVISFLADTRLRVAYFTDGQRVPEDIHLLDSRELIDKAEGLLNSSERWVTISSPEQDSAVDPFYFHSA